MNKLKHLILMSLAMLFAGASTLFAAGEGGEDGKRIQIPRFTELRRGQTSYVGTIVEDGREIRVQGISFTGNTRLEGLRNELSDARIRLSLGDVLTLEIIDPTYRSERFDNQEFIKARLIPKPKTPSGEHMPVELLIPRNVQFSATNMQTGLELSWWLRDVNKITIDDPQPIRRQIMR